MMKKRNHEMNATKPPFSDRAGWMSRIKQHWWKYALAGLGTAGLAVMGLAVLLFFVFTSRSPAVIPKSNVTDQEREALAAKWLNFQQEISTGKPAAPCSISIQEFNVFFTMLPHYKDHIHFRRVGDKFQGEASMPLDRWLPWIGQGRYLNGSDIFSVRLGKDGLIDLRIESAKVNGKRMPGWVLRLMERKELYQDIFHSMGGIEFSRDLAGMEMRDGCLMLIPKKP